MKQLWVILFLISSVFGQESTSLNTWKNIFQSPDLVNYFDGVFNSLGIVIEEDEESFTVYHRGDSFEFINGINKEDVDFIVPLKKQNILNMVEHAKDGIIDPEESWRILDVLFTPLTKVTLQNPVLSVNWRRKLAGVEDLTHVNLINPKGQEASKHTLIYVKGQWLVLKGLHGKPRRTYRMSPEQSLEYQKKIFEAMQQDSFWGWWKFSRFYKEWRKSCSVTHS
tara:strand:- start:456 stop:1127 length:672 start_codon:yes stop_codon:yes gene_type:complete